MACELVALHPFTSFPVHLVAVTQRITHTLGRLGFPEFLGNSGLNSGLYRVDVFLIRLGDQHCQAELGLRSDCSRSGFQQVHVSQANILNRAACGSVFHVFLVYKFSGLQGLEVLGVNSRVVLRHCQIWNLQRLGLGGISGPFACCKASLVYLGNALHRGMASHQRVVV